MRLSLVVVCLAVFVCSAFTRPNSKIIKRADVRAAIEQIETASEADGLEHAAIIFPDRVQIVGVGSQVEVEFSVPVGALGFIHAHPRDGRNEPSKFDVSEEMKLAGPKGPLPGIISFVSGYRGDIRTLYEIDPSGQVSLVRQTIRR